MFHFKLYKNHYISIHTLLTPRDYTAVACRVYKLLKNVIHLLIQWY